MQNWVIKIKIARKRTKAQKSILMQKLLKFDLLFAFSFINFNSFQTAEAIDLRNARNESRLVGGSEENRTKKQNSCFCPFYVAFVFILVDPNVFSFTFQRGHKKGIKHKSK